MTGVQTCALPILHFQVQNSDWKKSIMVSKQNYILIRTTQVIRWIWWLLKVKERIKSLNQDIYLEDQLNLTNCSFFFLISINLTNCWSSNDPLNIFILDNLLWCNFWDIGPWKDRFQSSPYKHISACWEQKNYIPRDILYSSQ